MSNHPLMQFFTYAHLRDERMQNVSKQFAELAQRMLELLPDNPQRDASLESLLDSKDRAVRAVIFKRPPEPTHQCKTCGAKWALDLQLPPQSAHPTTTLNERWSLVSPKCGPCCGAAATKSQLEVLPGPPPCVTPGCDGTPWQRGEMCSACRRAERVANVPPTAPA